MGIQVLSGRAFTWPDNENSTEVVIVSEDLIRRYSPNEDPIGKRPSINNRNGQPVWRKIIGVVNDVRHDGLAAQLTSPGMIVASRTRTDPGSLFAAVRRAIT